jgi:hypothetical protein
MAAEHLEALQAAAIITVAAFPNCRRPSIDCSTAT